MSRIDIFLQWMVTNWVEITGFVLGLVGVWFEAKQNIWCWPIGLLNVVISMWVFFYSKLYADVILQVFYLVMTIYGWYYWAFGGQKKFQLPIRRLLRKELIWMLVLGFGLTAVLGYFLQKYTDAAFPYWDSLVTVWGVIATYAMARKIIEHWIMWIIIDLNCTAIYFCKHLFAFSPLYFIFTLLAVYGFFRWRNYYRKQILI